MNEKRELLAEYAHEAWAGWMKYMLPTLAPLIDYDRIKDYPAAVDACARGHRLVATPYTLLPEWEKYSDRKEADKMLEIIRES